MSDRKSPIEQALDLFVYAPIGLLAVAREELPKLVERGHQELSNQATVARMMGEYAVAEGQKEVGRRLEQASETITGITSAVESRRSSPAAPASTTATSPPPPRPAEAPVPAPEPSTAPTAAPGPPAPSVDALAIHGYDALSASQVVQRLAGLSGDELESVRAYELATRGRKTILNRVEQLRTGNAH